mmetsp:Transcript_4913/g.14895  ORF Transcript_4913/g.14895 Transcript_4913/m.14895 type:complete len:263 (-) Transcript_4913:223-1011(-)
MHPVLVKERATTADRYRVELALGVRAQVERGLGEELVGELEKVDLAILGPWAAAVRVARVRDLRTVAIQPERGPHAAPVGHVRVGNRNQHMLPRAPRVDAHALPPRMLGELGPRLARPGAQHGPSFPLLNEAPAERVGAAKVLRGPTRRVRRGEEEPLPLVKEAVATEEIVCQRVRRGAAGAMRRRCGAGWRQRECAGEPAPAAKHEAARSGEPDERAVGPRSCRRTEQPVRLHSARPGKAGWAAGRREGSPDSTAPHGTGR